MWDIISSYQEKKLQDIAKGRRYIFSFFLFLCFTEVLWTKTKFEETDQVSGKDMEGC